MFNLKTLKNLDRDDLLELIGLERQRSTAEWMLPAIGLFSVGMLVGAGVGLLLAPKSGRELMDDLRTRLQSGQDSLGAGGYSQSSPSIERTPRSV